MRLTNKGKYLRANSNGSLWMSDKLTLDGLYARHPSMLGFKLRTAFGSWLNIEDGYLVFDDYEGADFMTSTDGKMTILTMSRMGLVFTGEEVQIEPNLYCEEMLSIKSKPDVETEPNYDNLIEFFSINGYLILHGVLPNNLIKRISPYLHRPKTTKIGNLLRIDESVMDLLENPHLSTCLKLILGNQPRLSSWAGVYTIDGPTEYKNSFPYTTFPKGLKGPCLGVKATFVANQTGKKVSFVIKAKSHLKGPKKCQRMRVNIPNGSMILMHSNLEYMTDHKMREPGIVLEATFVHRPIKVETNVKNQYDDQSIKVKSRHIRFRQYL